MTLPRGTTHEVVKDLRLWNKPIGREADVGSEWLDRAAKVERSIRCLRWMAGTAMVLTIILVFRVFTH